MSPKPNEPTGMYHQLLDTRKGGLGLEEALDAIHEDFEKTKAENVAKVVLRLEEQVRMYQDEANKLNQAAQAPIRRVQALKDYLRQNMEALNLDTIEGQVLKVRLQNSPPSCEVLDETWVPEQYREIITTIKIDRKAIIGDWKAGTEVPGTKVTQGKYIKIYP